MRRAAGRAAGCSNRRRMAIKCDYTVRGKCRTQQMLVCVSSIAHISDVVPDIDREEEEGARHKDTQTLSIFVFHVSCVSFLLKL